ncbi:MAG: peptidylprolyl isomerase [Myxococcaceae bacterium]
MKFDLLVALGSAASLSFAAGCGKPSREATAPAGEVVAQVGERTITADEFKARLNEQSPYVQARYSTLERKKEFLDGLVRFEVMAQEAERRGLDKDPEVRATLRKVMVQKLLHDQYDEAAAAKAVPEEDSKRYYSEHLAEFVKPERVRTSHVFLAAPNGSAQRAQVEKEVAKGLVEVRGQEAGPVKTAFAELARKRSDDATTKAQGGDSGFRTREELTSLWGEAFADRAFGLKAINEIGGVVATDKGFHLVKLTGRQAGLNQTFDSVRARIEGRLASERRSKAVDTFVAELRAKTPVKVDDSALSKVEVRPAGQMPSVGAVLDGAPPPAPSPDLSAPAP